MIKKFVKSPKFMWVVGGLLSYWFFGPSIPQLIRQAYVEHQIRSANATAKAKEQKPSPVITAPPPLPTPVASSTTPAVDPALHALMGSWEATLLMKEEPCSLSLELREDQVKPGQVLGYSKIACQPTMLEIMQRQHSDHKMTPAEALKAMQEWMKPSSTNFTGTAENGAIKLSAQNTFGLTGAGCSIASFTVMPAGTHELGTDFTENNAPGCEGAQLVMKKKQ